MKRKSVAVITSIFVFMTTSTISFADIVIDNPKYYYNYGYSLGRNTYKTNIQESTTVEEPTANQEISSSKSNVILDEYKNDYDNSYILPESSKNDTTQNNTTITVSQEDTLQKQKKLLNLINNEREKAGLSKLKLNTELCEIAQQKSKDMYDNNYFSHTSPNFGKTSSLLKSENISYKYFGENIARTYSIYSAHSGFMNSSGHRANVLNKNYNEIGIGIVGNYYTEVFIGN